MGGSWLGKGTSVGLCEMGTKPHFYAITAIKKETDLWCLRGSVDDGDAASSLRDFGW